MRSSGEDSNSGGGSDFWTDDMPKFVMLLRKARVSPEKGKKKAKKTLRQVAEILEPSYDTFYCTITRKVMEDPVTIVANGVTCERRAVEKWFEERGAICPKTMEGIESMEVEGNVALKGTITEWRKRSEDVRIKLACVALTLGGTGTMAGEATGDLHRLCRRSTSNLQLARDLGAPRLLAQLLEVEGSTLRCEALKALAFFFSDEEGKENVGTKQIEMTVRVLSSDDPSELDAAVSFLLELSKSAAVCRKVGLIPGAVLMLITLTLGKLVDDSVKENARKTLENLESFPANIKLMAEDGYLQPLLRNLIEGSDQVKLDMATHLGKLVLPLQAKGHVSPKAISTLLDMAKKKEPQARMAAIDALAQLSSHPSNANSLVRLDAIPLVVKPILVGSTKVSSSRESTCLNPHYSTILANILEHVDQDPQSLRIDSEGHTLASQYAIRNLTSLLTETAPTALDVVRILLSLTSSKPKKPADRIANSIRDARTVPVLVSFAGSDNEPLAVASLGLLSKLSLYIPTTISEALREGPLSVFSWGLGSNREITNRHVASAELLAGLPRNDPPLNKALIDGNVLTNALCCMEELQRSGRTVVSRDAKLLFEGLVGILVRFTFTCDAETCNVMIEKEMATVLTKLLGSASEEVVTLSALGLKNLSNISGFLAKPADPIEEKGGGSLFLLASCFGFKGRRRKSRRRKGKDVILCDVHGGECSEKTFCLVKTEGAVERLLGCVEHERDEVVEGVLLTLQTLLEGERVDGLRGVKLLGAKGGVNLFLRVLRGREKRGEEVRRRALLVIHKFLTNRMFVEEIEGDQELSSLLVRGLHNGDGEMREICESMLGFLNRVPSSSRSGST